MARPCDPAFLACDLGASSGRAIVGRLTDAGLRLEEVHRFANGGVRVGKRLFWDVLHIWEEVQHGLHCAGQQYGDALVSAGVDTWGLDFGLLGAGDTLLGNPFHYRDPHTDGMLETAFRKVSRERIYDETGIQFLQLNSLYQLLAFVETGSPLLEVATTFLNIPDLLNFWLTGAKASEFTIATTTQCYNPRTGAWALEMLRALGIPTHIFGEIIPPGTVLGSLRATVADRVGALALDVVAPAGHDTACAVAAVPAQDRDYIYLSSGTWSLMGVEIPEPLITPASLAADMTNEGGIEGTFRFLKNIMGLWLIQECRRSWAQAGQTYTYTELSEMAATALPFRSLIVPGAPGFLAPADMPAAIQQFCAASGQPAPESRAATARCVLESLALEYRRVAEILDRLVGHRLPVIHIIGGGAQNQLLNQFTADAAGRPVIAGPAEATAMGNILIQARALGYLKSWEEARAWVRRSVTLTTYEPCDTARWDAAFARYLRLHDQYLT
ncbi:MAG: rhamnulokinase [Anaerolineae bacterium]|nr:rhamnulokinase [Anaerolineae bacterium]